VSEESSTDAPGTAASGDEPVPGPVPGPEAPPRRSRRALLILSGAAVLSAALIAVAVVWSLAYGPPGPKYSRVPEPCSLISLATLNTFLPGATASHVSTAAPSHGKAAACGWVSTRDREDRTVGALVEVFSSPSAITDAEHDYGTWVSTIGHNKGIAARTQSVAGLGDRATALLLTARSAADFAAVVDANAVPGAYLIVRSSNAVLVLNYNIIAMAGGTTEVPTPGGAQLPDLISVARAILTSLARPATDSAAPGASSYPRLPHYAGQRDPCRLITTATLATYAPGATVSPLASNPPSAAQMMNSCSWGTTSPSPYVELTLTLFPDYASARQSFASQLQGDAQSVSGQTVTAGQFLAGLGDQAADIFQSRSGADAVELLVGSGNAVIDLSYTGPGAQSPDRAMLLAGGIAMARDALAALANPAVSSYPRGPVYASPHDPCTLIKASTLATYIPGVTETQNPGGGAPSQQPNPPGGEQESQCFFNAGGLNGTQLALFVSIYTDPDNALSGFESGVQYTIQDETEVTFNGRRQVKDLGQQAAAVLQTAAGTPDVDLFVLSGNAEIELILSDAPLTGPAMTHSALLAGDVAMARDVLADLPH